MTDSKVVETIARMIRNGNRFAPLVSMEQYLEERIERIPFSGCWIWTKSASKRGYATVCFQGKAHLAHRISYETFRGAIPEGMLVCHKCDVTSCINPDHLFLGTDRDNLVDAHTKGRRPKNGPTRGKCKNASLTPEQVKEIRAALSVRDCSLKELSRRLKVSYHTLTDIHYGYRY